MIQRTSKNIIINYFALMNLIPLRIRSEQISLKFDFDVGVDSIQFLHVHRKPNISLARYKKDTTFPNAKIILTYQCINVENHTSKLNWMLSTFIEICL